MDIRSSSSCRQENLPPYIHKVGAPPKENLFKEFKNRVKETMFADDPFRSFKDQTMSRKFVLGLQAVFPILDWGRSYSLAKFRGDLIAGLTIASLCIPQDIGYSKLANLDPQYGLYSSFVPPLIYAFMGSSRHIVIGPVAVVSLLLGTMLRSEIDPTKNASDYRRLAFTATFFAGVTQAALGILRLGFLIDLLSHAAVVGFMGGAAITIALQQLKGFLGIKKFTRKTDIVSVMKSEAVAIGRTFASMKEYQLDGNREMVALGVMNIVGSMTSCYVATGSFSRSAVNFMAGCNTAVSNIVMSLVVFLTLEFITPLFEYTPNAILASIIISAVIGLIDYDAAVLIWKIDKFDFIACMGAFLGVVFVSVEIGLLVAVAISFAKILLQVTRPRTAILGRVPRTNAYRNIQQYPEATKVPAVTDIDTSGIHALEELLSSLQKRDVKLVLANSGSVVMDKLHASGFLTIIGEDKIFLTVADAVLTCSPKLPDV
ncbi:unnamed protein product [Cuscuta campestris]|uniref:STAS domain-containing protein n=1 Tax=Cuscuta campestris TaxID=132261 RepID=A0A484LR78_9ASTE|nr:unnamed protein product [Cuscuta campestris]